MPSAANSQLPDTADQAPQSDRDGRGCSNGSLRCIYATEDATTITVAIAAGNADTQISVTPQDRGRPETGKCRNTVTKYYSAIWSRERWVGKNKLQQTDLRNWQTEKSLEVEEAIDADIRHGDCTRPKMRAAATETNPLFSSKRLHRSIYRRTMHNI